MPDKRQDQPDTEEDQDIAARSECPEIETDLPDAPNHGAEQQSGVQPKCCAFTAPQHPGDAKHHQTSDGVVPGAANRDQPASANEKI